MRHTSQIFALLLLVLIAACDDPVSLTFDLVAGNYVATVLTADGDDILAAGGSLSMTLGSGGTVDGTLDVPAGAGGPLTADLGGTYTVSGATLTFTQAADTFVRDATWTWSDGVLSGEWTGSSGSASVRMQRQ